MKNSSNRFSLTTSESNQKEVQQRLGMREREWLFEVQQQLRGTRTKELRLVKIY